MNRSKPQLTLEQIVRAVQQAVLNVSQPDETYHSVGASYSALKALIPLAESLSGNTLAIERISYGESHRLTYGPAHEKIASTAKNILGTPEHGEMLELYLVDHIRRETGLEAIRYTLHDRADFVLDWFRAFTSRYQFSQILAPLLAGVTSVFMPGVIIPFAGFYVAATGKVTGELHVLPHSRPATMPILSRSVGDKTATMVMVPQKIFTLRTWPQYLLR